MHLAPEEAARVDTGALAKAIRYLIGVDALQSDANAKTRASGSVLYQNKFALLGLWHIWEEASVLLLLIMTSRSGMGTHVRHGWTMGTGGVPLSTIPGEDLVMSHIVPTADVLRVLLVIVVLPCEYSQLIVSV